MDRESLKAYFLKQYDAYADALFRFCFFKVSDREKALEITQEVFMRFWDTLRSGNSVRHPRAFLYKTARNLVIDWYRRKKDDSLDVLAEGGLQPADDAHAHIEDSVEARRALAVIHELDEKDRDVLIMRYVDDLPPREIAEILDESANVVSVRINRALAKVQEKIKAYG